MATMSQGSATRAKKRLLVVDDDQIFREFVQEAAELLGLEAATAPDGAAAQEVFASFQPDIVFLDMMMPGADGAEFTLWLNLQPKKPRVYLVTGHDPDFAGSTGRLATALGMPGIKVLTKPVSLADLTTAFGA